MKRMMVGFILLFALLLTSCGEKERYQYTAEDRPIPYSNTNASRFAPPGMEVNVGMADVIAQLEITSGQVVEEMTLPHGVPYTACYYEAQVEDVWYGEPVDEDIELWFMGTGTILHPNDRLVAYLSLAQQNHYVTVDGEYSVFILNPPDDGLFPFAMIAEFKEMEGEDVQVLKDATDSVLAKIESGEEVVPEFLYGAVAEEYLPETAAE